VIVRGFMRALQTALDTCNQISRTIDVNSTAEMREIVTSAIGTKFSSRWGEQMVDIAIKAVRKVVTKRGDYTEVDVKRFVRIEKIPGGELSECTVLDGVMFNKDVTHAKMRRRIENPRILLLDCPLEYKKGESSTNVEIMNEEDFNALLRQEEEYVEQICANVSVCTLFYILLSVMLRPPPLVLFHSGWGCAFSPDYPLMCCSWFSHHCFSSHQHLTFLLSASPTTQSAADRGLPPGHRDHREGRVGPGAALLPQGRHHLLPPPAQDRPEPRRARHR
jgi:hypothetical protein